MEVNYYFFKIDVNVVPFKYINCYHIALFFTLAVLLKMMIYCYFHYLALDFSKAKRRKECKLMPSDVAV